MVFRKRCDLLKPPFQTVPTIIFPTLKGTMTLLFTLYFNPPSALRKNKGIDFGLHACQNSYELRTFFSLDLRNRNRKRKKKLKIKLIGNRMKRVFTTQYVLKLDYNLFYTKYKFGIFFWFRSYTLDCKV